MINHTAMEMAMVEEAMVDGEDVVGVEIIAHTAVGKGTTITVVVVPAMAGPSYGCDRGRSSGISKPPHSSKSVCHRCGIDNHWAKNCRTPRHLCDLYQESQKWKNPEAHLVHHDGKNDFDHDQDDLMDYKTSDCLRE